MNNDPDDELDEDPYDDFAEPVEDGLGDPTGATPPPPPPPQGIGFAQITCVECGYNLTGVTIGATCPECGTPVERSFQNGAPKTNGLAVASMVLGICSIVLCCGPGVITAILGLIFGIVSLNQINNSSNFASSSRGMAIAGICCSIVALLLFVVVLVSNA